MLRRIFFSAAFTAFFRLFRCLFCFRLDIFFRFPDWLRIAFFIRYHRFLWQLVRQQRNLHGERLGFLTVFPDNAGIGTGLLGQA